MVPGWVVVVVRGSVVVVVRGWVLVVRGWMVVVRGWVVVVRGWVVVVRGQTHHCLTKCLRRPSGWDESLWKWAREPEMKVSLAGLVLWHAPLTAGLVVRPLSGFSQRTSVGT